MPILNFISTPTQTNKAFVVTWSTLLNGDSGTPLDQSQYTDKSVQVSGTFGSGGSIRLLGSNDGINWNVLTDPQGNNLVVTASAIKYVAEATRWIKPEVTAGDGTTNLKVSILLKE
jgi:hypothetical protein